MAAVKKSVVKHAITISKRKVDGVYKGSLQKSQSPTKRVNALHVRQLPMLPQKRTLLSSKKPKMQPEAVKQLSLEKQKTSDDRQTFKNQTGNSKLRKKLNLDVKKTSTKPQTTRKAKSLPCNDLKRLSIKIQRQSLPGNFIKKRMSMSAKEKNMSKTQRRSLELLDSSDDDILYSLAVPWDGTETTATVNASSRKYKRCSQTETNNNSEASDDADVDSEISFPHQRKDTCKQKRKCIIEPASPKKSTTAVTSAMSPKSPVHTLVASAPMSNDSKTLNFMPDLSGMPTLPGSPSATAYKVLTDNFSRHMTRRSHRSAVEEDEDEVVRRMSVRQSENAFKYKEIVVKKAAGYTQVALFTQTKLKNALNPNVFHELCEMLHNATYDDSRLIMFTGSRGIFCTGIDLNFLTCGDRHIAAKAMSDALRDFISALIAFPKPIVAAVNGLCVGLGVALLPLCDIIYASDKASFYCPYARLCQTTEGCASYTFTQVMGMAMANEILLAGRKLTALEAYQLGLVSQVFWPTSLMQEVMPRVQNMAIQSAKALEATKLLIRSHLRTKLELTNDTECRMLAERWASPECQKVIKSYIEEERDL